MFYNLTQSARDVCMCDIFIWWLFICLLQFHPRTKIWKKKMCMIREIAPRLTNWPINMFAVSTRKERARRWSLSILNFNFRFETKKTVRVLSKSTNWPKYENERIYLSRNFNLILTNLAKLLPTQQCTKWTNIKIQKQPFCLFNTLDSGFFFLSFAV